MRKLNHPGLVAQVMATIDKILHMEKVMLLEEEEVKLHPSEIHLLLFLHARPESNATDIVRRFSVTKGAVSQTLSRLERKGVLIKGRNPKSQTELDLSLTKLGEKLTARAVEMKAAAERHYDQQLSDLDEPGRDAVQRFLEGMQVRFNSEG
jgi:DNA-binding MarR family transcriptional regulator